MRRMPSLDLDFVRAQFPALDTPWALFDNAGGSVPCRQVLERLTDYMAHRQVQLGASYAQSARAMEEVEAGRAAVARLLNADPGEVVLGASSTALAQLLARALRPLWREGDEVVVTNLDHETNVGPWRALEATGITVREWRFRPETGTLAAEDLEPLLTERTRLVAFTHCSNLAGTFHDVPVLARRIREAGALSCVDGVAYAPHRRVDVDALGVDFYLCSLYKVYGPHQSALFGRRELLERARGQNHFFFEESNVPGKLEPGGVNHELAASLAGVTEYLDAVDRHHFGDDDADPAARLERTFALFARHEERLAAPLLDFLTGRDDVQILGHIGPERARRAPTVSFVVDGIDSSTIPPRLDAREVAVRFGHFYAYRAVRDLGWMERGGVVRASLVHYNSADEVERLVAGLERALG